MGRSPLLRSQEFDGKQRRPRNDHWNHKPEFERLVQEEFVRKHFQNVDDLLTEALHALREKNTLAATSQPARKNLAQFLRESPFASSDLNLEWQQDYGRPVEL